MQAQILDIDAALAQLKVLEPSINLEPEVEKYLRENDLVLAELVEYLRVPLFQKLPYEVKLFYNGLLQTHLTHQPQYSRYYVNHVPNPKIAHEDIITQTCLFDGALAVFGIEEKLVVDRVSPQLQQEFSSAWQT